MQVPVKAPVELHAPAHWRSVDFLSDLHLQAAQRATFDAWRAHLGRTTADAVFILGDLFEVWVGDDAASEPGFEHECAQVLTQAAHRLDLYFMHGNRDFLLRADFARSVGMHLLDDPTTLVWAGRRMVLTHGDALCLDDVDYQAFRTQVRGAPWQDDFLSRSLEQRRAIAAGLRARSEQVRQQRTTPQDWADVDAAEARRWLAAAQATVMIHGHTHRPARHDLGAGCTREVLSDWDLDAQPPRAQVMRLDGSGLRRVNLT